jgi:hypothetical protein
MRYLLVSYTTSEKGSRSETEFPSLDAMFAEYLAVSEPSLAPSHTNRMFVGEGGNWRELTLSSPIWLALLPTKEE